MANIPILAVLSVLIASVHSFRVLPPNDNPEINEDLNLVEPKLDFWNVFLRPKSKTTFKSILRFLNSLEEKGKFSTEERLSEMQRPVQMQTEFVAFKLADGSNAVKNEDQYIVQDSDNPSIVSDEKADRESLSEEHPKRIVLTSISIDTSENSGNSDESNQQSDSAKISSSEESPAINSEQTKSPVETSQHHEPISYPPSLPKSLHNFNMDKPKFQHSFQDGWIF